MDKEGDPKKRERNPQDEQPAQDAPKANGTLSVHVVDVDSTTAKQTDSARQVGVVRQAHVSAWLEGSATPAGYSTAAAEVSGETLDSGDFVRSVPPGWWNVTAEAFGIPKSTRVQVFPKCEADVQFEFPINLEIHTLPPRSGDRQDERFYPAGSIIVATVDHALREAQLSKKPVVFEWFISGGSILETGEDATGQEIHIDTAGVRGLIEIEVRMSERNTIQIKGKTQ